MSAAKKECMISNNPEINEKIMSMPYAECLDSYNLNASNCGLAARVEWQGILLDKAKEEGIRK